MNRTRVEQVLNRFPGKAILIVGDVMLDEFIWGKVRRISPEAPVPVVEVIDETYRPGGSGNVAANIHDLEATAVPIGTVGHDAAADRILDLFQRLGIPTAGLVRCDRPTTLKTRIIAHNQQVVRTDRESKTPLSAETNARLTDLFLQYLPQ